MKHDTIEAARAALADAEADCAGDFGEDAVTAAWGDLVRSVAADCTPEVSAELQLRELGLVRCRCGMPLRPSESPFARDGALECPRRRNRPAGDEEHDVYVP